jgi:hypothetical protein
VNAVITVGLWLLLIAVRLGIVETHGVAVKEVGRE